MMNKCIKCGISQVDHQQIFLTQDKYCTVCNNKYKDRPRTKPIFQFTTIHESEFPQYNKWGQKNTKYRLWHDKDRLKGSAPATSSLNYKNYKEKQNKKMDEYI